MRSRAIVGLLKRSRSWLLMGAIALIAPRGLVAQEQPATPANVEQRLSDLERRLDELRKAVQELRQATQAAAPATPTATPSPADGSLPAEWVKALKWRSIGPAGMGGRITAISVFPADPSVYWVATASGGLLKTENNGVTFVHQFDTQGTVSIGDVCVAPSNKNVVWVGAGENNPRNSVSFGDGVYKSSDGGKTWTNMGLRKSFQTGCIVVHPQNPDVVYVGALGRLYGPNEERGLYKTSDGGKTWERVLYVDDKTGVIDIAMHPSNPETLIVSTWERQRDGFDSFRGEPPLPEGYDAYDPIKKWGPGSGIHKTTDGGKTWKRLTAGLPSCHLGRIDVDYYRKDPNVVYAIIDCQKVGMGTPPSRAYLGVRGEDGASGAKLIEVTAESPAAKGGLKALDVVKAVDNKPIKNYAEFAELLRGRKTGDKLVLQVARGDQSVEITVTLEDRPLGALAAQFAGPYLGIQGEDAPEGGARLTEISDNSPASKAGLKDGDVVKSLNNAEIAGYEELAELIRTFKTGDKLTLGVQREGKLTELAATLEERPLPAMGGPGGRGAGRFALGALLGAAGEDAEGGVRIARIFDERAAEKAGLEEGDLVQAVDAKAIADVEQLVALIRQRKEGEKLTLKVLRNQQPRELTLTLEAPPASPGTPSRTRPYTFMYSGQQPNVQEQQGPDSHEYGGVYKSTDGGDTWKRINSLNPRPMYFSQIRVDPSDDRYLYVLGISLHRSRDGGKTFTADGGRGVHADQHAMWIDPHDGRHVLVGTDGGYYVTWDRTVNWEHLNHMAIGQFYHVALDTRQPYRAYGGLQDNGSWGGPTNGLSGGPLNEDWLSVGGGDGFVCGVDPFDPDVVYCESQNGAMGRRNLRSGERASIRPRAQRGLRYRFNWNTPFILSRHNSGIFYCAGNYVFRSLKRGDDLKPISPEISRTGRGTGTALAESPRSADVLWAGTDDGNLWITRDGGAKWLNVADKVGLPAPRWVATVEPSRFVDGRCYVAFDAHRSDDDEPYLYVTEDFGETWKPLRANLPTGSTRCLREDAMNKDLLFVGTEFAVWASIDRGQHWTKINNNLPTVAVHELAIHPTAGEMVAATHGRSLWVLDIGPLRQTTPQVVAAPAHLFEPNVAVRWRSEPERATGGGAKRFRGDNGPRGAQIFFTLAKKPDGLALKIVDVAGQTLRQLQPKVEPGLNQVAWDLTRVAPRPAGQGRTDRAGTGLPAGRDAAAIAPPSGPSTPATSPSNQTATRRESGATGRRQGQGEQGGLPVGPGVYRVVLTVDGRELAQTLRVELDPTLPNGTQVISNEESEEEEEEEAERGKPPWYIDD